MSTKEEDKGKKTIEAIRDPLVKEFFGLAEEQI